MKKLFITLICGGAIATTAFSQGVGIGGTPHSSAMLDVQSTTRGLLVPRMTLAQRGAIASPANGLLIYQTDASRGFWYYDNTSATWRQLTTGGWLLNGNALTNPASDFVGTTDEQALTFRTNNTPRLRIANGNQLFALADGTAAAPFYSWETDSNTGIYRIGNDHIGVTTNGSMRISLGAQNGSFGFNKVPSVSRIAGNQFFEIYTPFEVGDDGAVTSPGYQATLGYWRGLEVEISPERNSYGYIGYLGGSTANPAWYRMYSYGFITASRRELKKNITPVNQYSAIENWVINDIKNIKPSFYHYNDEKNEWSDKLSTKYRPHYHLGVIVDESPDYVKDEAFSGIDGYSLASLSLVGTKYCINKLESIAINDFGTVVLNGQSVDVVFSSEYMEKLKGTIPVIQITLQDFTDAQIIVTKKSDKGFTIKSNKTVNNLPIDWVAFANVKSISDGKLPDNIDFNRIKVPDNKKKEIQNYFFNLKQTSALNKE